MLCRYFGVCLNKSQGFICTNRLCDSGNRIRYTEPNHSQEAILGDVDVKNDTLTFDVGDVHMEFNLLNATKCPSISDE